MYLHLLIMLHEASFIADGLRINIYVLRANITFSIYIRIELCVKLEREILGISGHLFFWPWTFFFSINFYFLMLFLTLNSFLTIWKRCFNSLFISRKNKYSKTENRANSSSFAAQVFGTCDAVPKYFWDKGWRIIFMCVHVWDCVLVCEREEITR